jgi:hypothetical protein
VNEKKASRWLKLFREFVKDIRISSKEIASSDDRGSPLNLWESQTRFLNEVGSGLDDGLRIFNCLKGRQAGVTTISLALVDVFWYAMHPTLIGCLVCDTEKNSEANRMLIERYVNSFPEGYFGDEFKIVKSNKKFIQYSNGSRLDLLVAGTKRKSISWGEGQGYAAAHLTEIANYGDEQGLRSLEESFAQQNPNRLFVYESTAKGYNMWQAKWTAGLKSLTEHSFFLGWWSNDMNRISRSDPRFPQFGAYPASGEERQLVAAVAAQYGYKIIPEQLAWIRWKEANAGHEQDLLVQNQPWTAQQAFVQTGYSFFQTRQINKDIKRLMEGGEEYGYDAYRYDNGTSFFDMRLERITDQDLSDLVELKVWEEPNPIGKYVIGFDPAYGRNEHKDKHAIQIYRCFADKMIQVAEYATADVDLRMATWAMAHMAGSYRDCVVNVELSGPGRMVMQELDHVRSILNAEMNAKYVQTHPEWTDALANARWYMYTRPDNPGKGYAYNFESTWRSKQELMHGMRSSYIMKEVEVKSLPLLNEMNIVVINGNEIGAPESRSESCKDDRVFATALAVRAWANWVRPEMLAQGMTYERVIQEEAGTATALGRSVNSIVYRFMKTQAELAQEEPDNRPRWKVSQGLE